MVDFLMDGTIGVRRTRESFTSLREERMFPREERIVERRCVKVAFWSYRNSKDTIMSIQRATLTSGELVSLL